MLSFCRGASGKSSPQDSARNIIFRLNNEQAKGRLSDPAYMDSVFTITRNFLSDNIHFTNKEMLELLSVYRQVIWNSKTNALRKRQYYGILANQAQMTGRPGEMLYYGEKIDKAEQELTGKPSLTSQSIITGYYEDQGSLEKIREIFQKEKNYLFRLPAMAADGSLSREDLVQGTIVLQRSARAMFDVKDTSTGDAILSSIAKIVAAAKERFRGDQLVLSNLFYLQRQAEYDGAVARQSAVRQKQEIDGIARLAADTNTPGYLINYIQGALLDLKVVYYLRFYNKDSVNYYLNACEAATKDEEIPYNKYLLKKYRAQSLYNEKRYRESADVLVAATGILDTARSVLVKDIGDMLYARAQAEEQQLLLAEAEHKRRTTENHLIITGIIIVILILSGVLIIGYIRRRQKARFWEFKLNMARNIHDETNPALLYAKALAKTSRPPDATSAGAKKSELEKHIEHTIELIRSLSHDLKSDKQHTVGDLVEEIEKSLKKLGPVYGFSYHIQSRPVAKHFLSHQQFIQLKSILLECVSNTIKHAVFSKIDLVFRRKDHKLCIDYTDNGGGWPADGQQAPAGGIGLANMKERSEQLQGSFDIQNNHPDNYRITISVPLR